MTPPQTLVAGGFGEILAERAGSTPDATAFIYLRDGECDEDRISYGALHRRAGAVAALLRQHTPAGSRALILFPPGLDYVAAVFGCFYARVIGVPAPPPSPKRLERTLPRLLTIAADARPDVVLTTSAIREAAEAVASAGGPLAAAVWIAVDGQLEVTTDALAPEAGVPSEVALLQYTSGSTVAPRGVMLTNGNLTDNSSFIAESFGHSSESRGFIWLPPYHDMGLIGGILQPVYVGFPCVLTSPIAIIKRPVRWLAGISRYEATTSGGPNFAYDLCARQVSPAEREKLDLASWEVAFNGAEPVRAETLESFAEAFASCGFRPGAFFPCYGLAEATLMVTASSKDEPPASRWFDADALLADRAAPSDPTTGTKRLVGCGRPAPGTEIAIVDPATAVPRPDRVVGEIWVSGPGVAAGYWGFQSDVSFGARFARGRSRSFLRTGDLGFVDAGELFVVGRLKDLLIVSGRNHHPHDIEDAAERAHPLLRRNCSAAFAFGRDGDSGLAIVMEVEEDDANTYSEVLRAVRGAVSQAHGLPLERVSLCAAGEVPKTTSGKVQRALCRSLLESGELRPVASWRRGPRGP